MSPSILRIRCPTEYFYLTRILFDMNLVNLTFDCGEFIFDGGKIPEKIPKQAIQEVLSS